MDDCNLVVCYSIVYIFVCLNYGVMEERMIIFGKLFVDVVQEIVDKSRVPFLHAFSLKIKMML